MYKNSSSMRTRIPVSGKSQRQIQQIQQASILHIRSISQQLFSLIHQIDDMQPSMMTPTASPINYKYKSAQNSKTISEDDDLMAFSFLKNKEKKQKVRQAPVLQQSRKGSAVHYSSYMKPTHNLKEKIREILLNQREQKQLQEIRDRRRIDKLKEKANKNFIGIESRYAKYDDKKADKNEAIASRMIEKETLEMSEVTFKPKVNHNFDINEPFEERLEINKHKKFIKEGDIIKDALKGHTYKPKINSHKHSQSKIKKIWSDSPQDPSKQKMYRTQQLSKSLFADSPVKEDSSNHLTTTVADLDFVINENLFGK